MKLGIATSFGKADKTWKRYVSACKHLEIDYMIVDILSKDWLKHVKDCQKEISGLLVGPPCQNIEEYDIYMERLYFIVHEFKIPIYPSYKELKLYENKKYCTAWLDYHGFPLPKTSVLANKVEALSFLRNANYPIVIKASIGAGSSTVRIVKKKRIALSIAQQAFGLNRFFSFGYTSWIKYSNYPLYLPLIGSSMKHYMLVQEYIPIKWEWRIIKINESYFGHQKLLKGQYASGSDSVGWVSPPLQLLDLIRNVCEIGNFYSMAMDVFESIDGKYYINELQSMFGSYDDSQMYIDGHPGRYKFSNGMYQFEEGYFNKYGSCLLRVEHFKFLLENGALSC